MDYFQAVHSFAAVDEAADSAKETLQELIETLEAASASTGLVSSLVHNLTQAVSKVRYDGSHSIPIFVVPLSIVYLLYLQNIICLH